MPGPWPDSFASTRAALHALAEHVIAAARYRVEGRISLVPATGGFGTPLFGDRERVRVEGVELVHERPGTTTRVVITTLGAAAQFVGIPLGAPTEVYKPATACLPDAPLAVDAASARALADWYAFGAGLLDDVRSTYRARGPSPAVIWPEHFDLACEVGAEEAERATYGASPGDSEIPQPYLYVAPWDAERRTGRLGAHPFGAACTTDELEAATEPRRAGLDFYTECAALLLGDP